MFTLDKQKRLHYKRLLLLDYIGGLTPFERESAKMVLKMCYTPIYLKSLGFPVPCGKCLGCLQAYSTMWTGRILDEAKQYQNNCFVTLTYAETDGVLHKDHLQKFLKRLRKKYYPLKIRYFACGEYGSKNKRPHFHIILFNYIPEDLEFFYREKNYDIYKSKILSDLWKYGFITVSYLDEGNIKYVTKYMAKLDNYDYEVKPYTVMSRRPGIGANSINEDMLLSGVRYIDGKEYALPKFYLDKLEQCGYNVDMIKASRKYIAKDRSEELFYENGKFSESKAWRMREIHKLKVKELKTHKTFKKSRH